VRAAASPEVTGNLDVHDLAEGRYTLVARVSRASGEPVGEDRIPVRKLGKPHGSEVRIDGDANIVVDGRPRFLIGWYGDVPDDPRPDVLALQNLRSALILSKADPRPVRESFAHGVYSIVNVDPFRVREVGASGPDRTAVLEEIRTARQSPATVAALEKVVQAVRDEPGLLGYYLADEPEIAGYRSDYLENAYARLAELDPYHPIVVTNESTAGLATHGVTAADILNPDPYTTHVEQVATFLRAARQLGHPGQALMATLWQASWKHQSESDDRDPNPFMTTRAQYLSAVALDARGFTGFMTPFFMPEPVLRYGLPAIWRELRFIEPAILAPAPAVQPTVDGSNQVYAWIRSSGGQVYVIAANVAEEPAAVTIHHPLLGGMREIGVPAEGRTVTIAGDALRDAFSPGAVHVYTTDPAGKALPSLEATQAEIAGRGKLQRAQDDLLHESHGTRVYSVNGALPPFPRFYEYVVNGVTDDQGWHVASIGPTRPWVEIALPAPKSVGQIVVYTPNLGDFDLELSDAGGARHFAQIRGNRATEVRVPVRPAVTMIKLRLTAVACRPDATPPGPLVHEIEAFAEVPKDSGVAWVTSPGDAPAPSTAPAAAHPQTTLVERFSEVTQHATPAGAATKGWTFDSSAVSVTPGAHGGIVAASTAAVGYAAMSRPFAYQEGARYLQAQIGSVEGEGYRFFSIAIGAGSASWIPLVAQRPGLYTVDLHALGPTLTDEKTRELSISLRLAGSSPGRRGSPAGPPGLVRVAAPDRGADRRARGFDARRITRAPATQRRRRAPVSPRASAPGKRRVRGVARQPGAVSTHPGRCALRATETSRSRGRATMGRSRGSRPRRGPLRRHEGLSDRRAGRSLRRLSAGDFDHGGGAPPVGSAASSARAATEPFDVAGHARRGRHRPLELQGARSARIGDEAERVAGSRLAGELDRHVASPGTDHERRDRRHRLRVPRAAVPHLVSVGGAACNERQQAHDIAHVDPVTQLTAASAQLQCGGPRA
jgi:hypothetical protein